MDRILPDGTWGYVSRDDTGELVSEGTVIADPLPDGLTLLERVGRADPDTEKWNEAARDFRPFTNVERIAQIDTDIADLQQERARLQGG